MRSMAVQPQTAAFNTVTVGTRSMAVNTMSMGAQQARVILSSPATAQAPVVAPRTVVAQPVMASSPAMVMAARPMTVSPFAQPGVVFNDPNNLLAAGTVISSRVVSIDELVARGRLDPGTGFVAVEAMPQAVEEVFDPALLVAQAWQYVHEQMMGGEANARVPREVFVEYCMRTAPGNVKLAEYEAYLHTLFDTALSLMLPSEKNDLGKHCFGYAAVLAQEFYFDQPADALSLKADLKPQDRLAGVRKEMDADWAAVEKDPEGRVSIDAFVNYFMSKHGSQIVPESQGSYDQFLVQDFRSALAMMLPDQKTTLGGHCFRYAGIMAGEFYFDAANQATAGCGCSAPVADILGVTK